NGNTHTHKQTQTHTHFISPPTLSPPLYSLPPLPPTRVLSNSVPRCLPYLTLGRRLQTGQHTPTTTTTTTTTPTTNPVILMLAAATAVPAAQHFFLRTAFVWLVVVPAVALVVGRGHVALTDPVDPHLATQNMFLAVVYAYAIACTRASFIPAPPNSLPQPLLPSHHPAADSTSSSLRDSSLGRRPPPPPHLILIGFGAAMISLAGALILLYNYAVTLNPDPAFAAGGFYFLLIGLALAVLRLADPRVVAAAAAARPAPPSSTATTSSPPQPATRPALARRAYSTLRAFHARLLRPTAPRPAAYFALFLALLFASVLGLLQPGIGLAFRWLPYPDPKVLTPPESLICAFFLPAVFFLLATWHRIYDPDCVLFAEFLALMGFFHGFAMMVDSVAGTQGNTNVHHVVGGDVVLMWVIGIVFTVYHPRRRED
ncbi:hypothetical protein DFJ73DRAFT_904948, partial [Zopfochytrium polystomum]